MKENEIDQIMNQLDVDALNRFLLQQLDDLAEFAFNVVSKVREIWQLSKASVDELDSVAQCMIQMLCLKTRTIIQMANGTELTNSQPIRILNVSSLFSIIRSLQELCFIFHNIYAMQETEDERKVVFNIWLVKGLKNRQGFVDVPPELVNKNLDEQKQIENIKNDTISLLSKMNVPQKISKQITDMLNQNSVKFKGYYFVRTNGEYSAFKNLFIEEESKWIKYHSNYSYRLFSMHTHPSYLGVLQFGQMYENDQDKLILKTALVSAYIYISMMLYDYIQFSEDAYNAATNIDKDLLNILMGFYK